jgi:hypothetical protein
LLFIAKEASNISELSLDLLQQIFSEIEKLPAFQQGGDSFSDFVNRFVLENNLPSFLNQTLNLRKDFNINEFAYDQDVPLIKSLKVV